MTCDKHPNSYSDSCMVCLACDDEQRRALDELRACRAERDEAVADKETILSRVRTAVTMCIASGNVALLNVLSGNGVHVPPAAREVAGRVAVLEVEAEELRGQVAALVAALFVVNDETADVLTYVIDDRLRGHIKRAHVAVAAALADTAKAAAEHDEAVRAEERKGERTAVRALLVDAKIPPPEWVATWLTEHDAEVRAKALQEGFDDALVQLEKRGEFITTTLHPIEREAVTREAVEKADATARKALCATCARDVPRIDSGMHHREASGFESRCHAYVVSRAIRALATSEPAKASTVPALPVDDAAEARIEKLLAEQRAKPTEPAPQTACATSCAKVTSGERTAPCAYVCEREPTCGGGR